MIQTNALLRYKIRNKIGTGGMASVYRALDRVLNREIAVKMVHAHLSERPETIRRFSNEAQAIAHLSHENIIRIFDFGITPRPFIIMELIEGITLADIIVREGCVPNLVTMEIARQILSALSYAHKNGIFHRDIKPANILIDHEGRVYITDFGIAYIVNTESLTLTGTLVGSPSYISPEQLSGTKITGTTDIFSLGIVLYQCCTGILPFTADTPHGIINAILHHTPLSASDHNRQVLLEFSDLIDACLDKNSTTRPTADDVAARLASYCDHSDISCGKHRVAAFLKNPTAQRAAELTELHSLYLHNARAALLHKDYVRTLRSFDQASRLKALSPADQKLERNLQHKKSAIYFASQASTVLILLALVFFIRYVVFSQQLPTSSDAEYPVRVFPVEPESPKLSFTPASSELITGSIYTTANTPLPSDSVTRSIDYHNSSYSRGELQPVNTTAPSPPVVPRGFITCLTNPPWVTVTIDRIKRGQTPTLPTLSLPAGLHEIVLQKEHFADIRETFTITPAETTVMRIQLSSLEKDSLSP